MYEHRAVFFLLDLCLFEMKIECFNIKIGAGLVDLPDEPVGDVALQRRLRRGRDELARSPGTERAQQ